MLSPLADSRRSADLADDKGTMPMLVILACGGAVCGWSILLIFSGERQRKLAESLNAAAPVKPNKKN